MSAPTAPNPAHEIVSNLNRLTYQDISSALATAERKLGELVAEVLVREDLCRDELSRMAAFALDHVYCAQANLDRAVEEHSPDE